MGLAAAEVAAGLRARKKASTRTALQETALKLFQERGFTNVSVDEIAMEADVSRSTFFRYFGSKEAVLMREIDESGDVFLRHLRARPVEEGPLKAFEEALFATSRDAANRDVQEQQRVVSELLRTDPALTGRRLAEVQRWVGLIADTLAERAGRTEPDLEDRLAAAICLTITEEVGNVLQETTESDPEPVMRKAFETLRSL